MLKSISITESFDVVSSLLIILMIMRSWIVLSSIVVLNSMRSFCHFAGPDDERIFFEIKVYRYGVFSRSSLYDPLLYQGTIDVHD